MATKIGVWQISNGKMVPIETSLAEAGRTEQKDLEQWIKSNQNILGEDILIIGEQVQTKSGRVDFLGIDRLGNTISVELKRDRIPREALAQAMDYASQIASWDFAKLSEECERYAKRPLDAYMNESFEDVDLEDISVNQTQRILVVGISIEESLQRMIEWLSNTYGVSANALILKYIKTISGDELIARTTIIPEEVEIAKIQKQQRKIPMSDEPGSYGDDELKALLKAYLSEDRAVPRFIRGILLPLCLDHEPVKRDEIKKELSKRGEAKDERHAGIIVSAISRELGIEQRACLRQVIRYDKPNPWEKENYRIDPNYKEMVKTILGELKLG